MHAETLRYPFVAIDAALDEADELAALLFELGAGGVEERDEQTLVRGAGQGRVTLVGSFEKHEDAHQAIAALREHNEALNARLEEVIGDAWRDAWKEHFAPFLLTPRIRVVPPWVSDFPIAEGELKLELEPGRAFGTGLHPTTSLVAEMLDEHAAGLVSQDILDVGTGSGILAFCALLFGASKAWAIDIDEDVIEIVRENAERNSLSDRIHAEALPVDSLQRSFAWVLANIEARVLLPLAPALLEKVQPGGRLILSGLLEGEAQGIIALYTSLRPTLSAAETKKRPSASGESWVAILFVDRP